MVASKRNPAGDWGEGEVVRENSAISKENQYGLL
jgi:hypothetical protein